ncbi:transcriptional regulator [Candidatus Saccharibacteria bacterium CPR2]|nr:transcriptional regulator [Candidatus Saccharibacteria bacterium CPR2]
MIDQLFGSKTRVKLLHLFMNNPNRSFYVREITRKIDEQINSVRRELSNMLSIGIISSDTAENKLYYEVNQNYPHYQALRSIFTNAPQEEIGVVSEDSDMTKRVRALGSVDLAILTGGFSRDSTAGVDILIVGDINKTKLNNFIGELEKEESREILYTTMGLNEFQYRRDVKDRFINNVLSAKKTILIDNGLLGE